MHHLRFYALVYIYDIIFFYYDRVHNINSVRLLGGLINYTSIIKTDSKATER